MSALVEQEKRPYPLEAHRPTKELDPSDPRHVSMEDEDYDDEDYEDEEYDDELDDDELEDDDLEDDDLEDDDLEDDDLEDDDWDGDSEMRTGWGDSLAGDSLPDLDEPERE